MLNIPTNPVILVQPPRAPADDSCTSSLFLLYSLTVTYVFLFTNVVQSIHQLRSQSSWFANAHTHNAPKSSECDTDDAKSTAGMTTISGSDLGTVRAPASATTSVSALSRGPSVHARSTTAVEGMSGFHCSWLVLGKFWLIRADLWTPSLQGPAPPYDLSRE